MFAFDTAPNIPGSWIPSQHRYRMGPSPCARPQRRWEDDTALSIARCLIARRGRHLDIGSDPPLLFTAGDEPLGRACPPI